MTRYPISYQNGGKMAKTDTLFMTNTAEKPTLWGRTYLYSPYKGVPPPPGLPLIRGFHINLLTSYNILPHCISNRTKQ